MIRTKKDEHLRDRGVILFDMSSSMSDSDLVALKKRLAIELERDKDKLAVKYNAYQIASQELQCRGLVEFYEPY